MPVGSKTSSRLSEECATQSPLSLNRRGLVRTRWYGLGELRKTSAEKEYLAPSIPGKSLLLRSKEKLPLTIKKCWQGPFSVGGGTLKRPDAHSSLRRVTA
jgi:hypothetical protein